MTSEEFIHKLEELKRPTREMLITPGDPGCNLITKISGVPWWPADHNRPTCSKGHFLSFIGQFLLSDIPNFESHADSLVSFHYCQQCAYDGNMSFGWEPLEDDTRYDVTIHTSASSKNTDDLGTIAEVVVQPHTVTFRNLLEVPGYEDTIKTFSDIPGDYPQGDDDLDENIYTGLIHVMNRKLGGWPSWVQYPNPPDVSDDEQLYFLGQLDWSLCDESAWACGGYAYLFIILSHSSTLLRGELVIETA